MSGRRGSSVRGNLGGHEAGKEDPAGDFPKAYLRAPDCLWHSGDNLVKLHKNTG